MSAATAEHTDQEYLEAISQGVMAVPGVSGQGHSAIEVAQSVLKWLRNRGLVPRPDPKKVIAKTLRVAGGRGYPEMSEAQANYMAGWIEASLSREGFILVPRDWVVAGDPSVHER
jgi:hypothetical protein